MKYIGQWVMEVRYYCVLVKTVFKLRRKGVKFSTFIYDCN